MCTGFILMISRGAICFVKLCKLFSKANFCSDSYVPGTWIIWFTHFCLLFSNLSTVLLGYIRNKSEILQVKYSVPFWRTVVAVVTRLLNPPRFLLLMLTLTHIRSLLVSQKSKSVFSEAYVTSTLASTLQQSCFKYMLWAEYLRIVKNKKKKKNCLFILA